MPKTTRTKDYYQQHKNEFINNPKRIYCVWFLQMRKSNFGTWEMARLENLQLFILIKTLFLLPSANTSALSCKTFFVLNCILPVKLKLFNICLFFFKIISEFCHSIFFSLIFRYLLHFSPVSGVFYPYLSWLADAAGHCNFTPSSSHPHTQLASTLYIQLFSPKKDCVIC